MKAKEIAIKGKVHDVGYRLFLLSEAESIFIEKFDARNVLVEGEQHLIVRVEGVEERIKRFIVFAESNYPPGASVESVAVKDYGEEVRSIDSFRQSLIVSQLTKMAQAGVGMLRKQDETIKVIKEESEKTREVVEKVRAEVEKTGEVVSMESEKTRAVLKEKIEEDVKWLKEEIIGIKATLDEVTEKVGVD
jgi:acylphosphatase